VSVFPLKGAMLLIIKYFQNFFMGNSNSFWINGVIFRYEETFDANSSRSNLSILEHCENVGILIPHYCYHKDLSIAGNCRMCLIEMTKSPKPIVSCSLNAQSTLSNGNRLYTNSPLVKKSRENIMEFLLLNHPLDCPMCDQGGECDLQDQSLFFGLSRKRFYHQKRYVHNKYLGFIVKTVMTRCIHCTRCLRFSKEVAGVEELGVFGRGSKSEIGTYVTQLFNSELSGNLIDICPVGALTSKPYPFAYRDWELKKIKTIDPSDGFGTDLLVYLKDNSIVKVLPGFSIDDHFFNSVQWITDKTRFVFDGMNSFTSISPKAGFKWKSLLTQILTNLYILDHLAKHNLVINTSIFLIDENTNIETLSILLLLRQRYSFFKLRRSVNTSFNTNLEFFFKTNTIFDTKKISQANACLFVGTHVRYDSPYLNLKLKKRFIAGNFQTFSIGSKLNLTFSNINIGSNLKKLKNLCEGNTSSGVLFRTTKNLLTLVSLETSHRLDNSSLLSLLKDFNDRHSTSHWYVFNMLSTSLNALGLNYFNQFKRLYICDLVNTNSLFLLGGTVKPYHILENYVERCLLKKALKVYKKYIPTFIMELTNYSHFEGIQKLKKNFFSYYPLLSNKFFETSASFVTTLGLHKHVVRFIEPSLSNTKEDWQILRKLFCMLADVHFVGETFNKISFNLKSMSLFKNYVNFLFKTSQTLTNLTFYINSRSQNFIVNTITLKTVFYTTQFKIWIKDFYIGGFDCYSKHSKLMIGSSISTRNSIATF